MHSMCNSAVMITMLAIIIVSLLAVEPVYSAPTVSAPEFTVQLIAHPYDAPTTYSTDKYTGENITHPGYPVENKTIAIIIKNQHFMSSLNGETYRLFYNVRTKGHFETTWIETIPNETRPIEALRITLFMANLFQRIVIPPLTLKILPYFIIFKTTFTVKLIFKFEPFWDVNQRSLYPNTWKISLHT